MRSFSSKVVPVENRDVVLAAHRDPDLAAVRGEEGLVRRTADIGHVLHRVGRGVDEGDRVRADRHDRERPVVGREAHAVHQDLTAVQRAEVLRLRLAQPDDAEQRVVGGVGDRDRVRELLGSIDPVAVTHRDIRGGGRCGGLARERSRRGRDPRARSAGFRWAEAVACSIPCSLSWAVDVAASESLAWPVWGQGSKGAAARRLPCAWRRSPAAG